MRSSFIFALVFASCGGSSTLPVEPSAPPSTARAEIEPEPHPAEPPAPPGCAYVFENAEVGVRPSRDARPFTVLAARATMRASADRHALTADVRGPLSFYGTSTTRALRLAEPRELEGFGRLPAGLVVASVAAHGDDALASSVELSWAQPASDSPLSRLEVAVALPPLPCAAFAHHAVAPQPAESAVEGELAFGGAEIQLAAAPDSAQTLAVRAHGAVAVFVRERRGAWVRVELPSSQGASIGGWLRRTQISARRPSERGGGALIGALGPYRPEAPGERGLARLRRGARVYAAPNGDAWATIGEGDGFEVLRSTPDAPWVLIERAPNARVVGWEMGDDDARATDRAWVRREDVERFVRAQ